jgi:hypothetical protein
MLAVLMCTSGVSAAPPTPEEYCAKLVGDAHIVPVGQFGDVPIISLQARKTRSS